MQNQSAFHGPIFHSTQWDPSQDYSGKKIGIIGTGASAVQIVPNIAPEAHTLNVFQRTPAWVPDR